MSLDALRNWRQQGAIRLYRAKRWRGEAWHLEGEAAGFASLAELLRLLQSSEYLITRILTISGPPAGTDLHLYSKYRYAKTWKIAFQRTVPEPYWEWSGDTHDPVLHLGAELLTEFIECLANEPCEDYGIGKKEKSYETELADAEIWFWRTMGA